MSKPCKRNANDAIIYGPAPAAKYPVRPFAAAPAAKHTAYIVSCQLADEIRDTKFPHGGPVLNHKLTDAELKTILLDALAASTLRAYQTLYQQYCNCSSTGKTYQDLYNDIHDLVKYDRDGIKSSIATGQGASRRAAEAATRIAPEGTSRSQPQRTISLNSKLQPTP